MTPEKPNSGIMTTAEARMEELRETARVLEDIRLRREEGLPSFVSYYHFAEEMPEDLPLNFKLREFDERLWSNPDMGREEYLAKKIRAHILDPLGFGIRENSPHTIYVPRTSKIKSSWGRRPVDGYDLWFIRSPIVDDVYLIRTMTEREDFTKFSENLFYAPTFTSFRRSSLFPRSSK